MKREILLVAALAVVGCDSDDSVTAHLEIANPELETETVFSEGKAIFDQWCWECHGKDNPYGMASWALKERYKGSPTEFIELRTDLSRDYVEHFVRKGQGIMPNFRETEITSEQLSALVDYLTEDRSD